MADIEVFRRTDQMMAHHENMRPYLRSRMNTVARIGQMLLDTRSKERTGDSQIYAATSGKLDAYVTITDKSASANNRDADEIAAIISYQHNILWDALEAGFK